MSDETPRPRRPAPPKALWWSLAAVAAIVAGMMLFRPASHPAAPAERNTATVDRAPVQLPASR